MTIRAVLFDMGGPVCRTPFEMARRLERVTGAPSGTFAWTGPFDPETDELWQQMQTTAITERDYWRIRAEEAAPFTGGTSVKHLFRIAFADPEESIRPEAMEFLLRCRRAGLRTGILTNDMRDFNEPGWADRVEFVQQVEPVVDGGVIGILKPDPRIYGIALEHLGVRADECVFIDDQPFNIEGAQQAGLQTVWFDVTDPIGSYGRAAGAIGPEFPAL